MNRQHAERDARIFEMEFWNGREKPDGSFADIERLLTEMQIEAARAQIQATSRQYSIKQRGLPYASSAHYPSSGRMKIIAPTDEQMRQSWLNHILNGE